MGLSLSDAQLLLGALAKIDTILTKVTNLEVSMATAKEQLDALKAQLSDTTADVLAKIDQLMEQAQNLSPEAQATLDEIKAGVQSLDEAVGDADGSDTPPDPEPVPEP